MHNPRIWRKKKKKQIWESGRIQERKRYLLWPTDYADAAAAAADDDDVDASICCCRRRTEDDSVKVLFVCSHYTFIPRLFHILFERFIVLFLFSSVCRFTVLQQQQQQQKLRKRARSFAFILHTRNIDYYAYATRKWQTEWFGCTQAKRQSDDDAQKKNDGIKKHDARYKSNKCSWLPFPICRWFESIRFQFQSAR